MAGRLTVVCMALALLGGAIPDVAEAQNIVLKTVHIPTGEQFLLFPSHTLGMGATTIAVDDRDGRPFTNPAVRANLESAIRLYASPTFYGEANQWVGGRTLPLAAAFAGDRVHGALGLAVQQLQDRRGWWGGMWWENPNRGRSIQEDPSNTYLFGSLGARISDRFSIGASGFHATLGAVDGVNMLYGRANHIAQDGTFSEFRVGAAGDLGGDRSLEATITRTAVDMVHDVDYMDWIWDDEPWIGSPTTLAWSERNEDHTITWGARVRLTQPVGESSRIGFVLAGSTKDHPKIPNYNIVDIPRDPGNSAVFNLGVGAARSEAGATVSFEVVFEPGRSHTWAFADSATTLPSGAVLLPGDKTVDNQFRFMNWNLGVGFERELERTDWQLGLRVRQINYTLDQDNFLAERRRETRESWLEWTPSWGAAIRFGDIELRYAGRFTTKGWPEMFWWGRDTVVAIPDSGVDFVVGPTGPVTIPSYRVTTHRVGVSVPFGL